MGQTTLLAVALCAASQFIFLLNHRYLIRGILFTGISGTACLYILSLWGSFSLPITVPTLAVSAVMGIPGCVFLLFSKLICGL